MEAARLRFGMIAPVIQETYPDESVMAYCRRVSRTPMRLPDGRTVKYKPKTIGKWVSLYRNGGIDALTPKTRSDLGKTRVLTEEAIDEIYRIKQKYPRLNATQIHARLVQEGLIPATVSVASVQRFVKRQGDNDSELSILDGGMVQNPVGHCCHKAQTIFRILRRMDQMIVYEGVLQKGLAP